MKSLNQIVENLWNEPDLISEFVSLGTVECVVDLMSRFHESENVQERGRFF